MADKISLVGSGTQYAGGKGTGSDFIADSRCVVFQAPLQSIGSGFLSLEDDHISGYCTDLIPVPVMCPPFQ